jgi:hypothetical protein
MCRGVPSEDGHSRIALDVAVIHIHGIQHHDHPSLPPVTATGQLLYVTVVDNVGFRWVDPFVTA